MCAFNSTNYQSKLDVHCDVGYELSYDVYSTTVECLGHANWSRSADEIVCKPVKCHAPVKIPNGKLATSSGLG